MLGLTPLALVLLYSANLLFRLPRSPLGREPLYLSQRGVGVEGRTANSQLNFFMKTQTVSVAAKKRRV